MNQDQVAYLKSEAGKKEFNEEFGNYIKEAAYQCHNCGEDSEEKLKRCGKCRIVAYCSVECQKENWLEHKLECPKLANMERLAKIHNFLETIPDFQHVFTALTEHFRVIDGLIQVHCYNPENKIFTDCSEQSVAFDFSACPNCVKKGIAQRWKGNYKNGCSAGGLNISNENGEIHLLAHWIDETSSPTTCYYFLKDSRDQPSYTRIQKMPRRLVHELLQDNCSLVLESVEGKVNLRLVFHGCFHILREEDWVKQIHKH